MPINSATVTADVFRADFPEFADKSKYKDSAIAFWLSVAYLKLNPARWLDTLNLGIELFVAHNIVLELMAQEAALKGNWPGLNKGVISAENVGPASVSFAPEYTIVPDAGHWNLTVYGTRFMYLTNMAGAGPVQLSGAPGSPGDLGTGSGQAWPG